MPVELLWTIIGTQIATWVTLVVFVNNRLDAHSHELRKRIDGVSERIDAQGRDLGEWIDAQGRELRREFREQFEAQGRVLGARIDALTARFDAHLEHHAT